MVVVMFDPEETLPQTTKDDALGSEILFPGFQMCLVISFSGFRILCT